MFEEWGEPNVCLSVESDSTLSDSQSIQGFRDGERLTLTLTITNATESVTLSAQ